MNRFSLFYLLRYSQVARSVSYRTLVSDKGPGLNWLKHSGEFLSLVIENARGCFGFDLIWHSNLSPLDSAFSCVRFISRFYLISPETPALSHQKAKPIRKEWTFDPEFLPKPCNSPDWINLTHMPTPEWRTVTRERPWLCWLKCNPVGLRVRENRSPQANQQTIPRNQHL